MLTEKELFAINGIAMDCYLIDEKASLDLKTYSTELLEDWVNSFEYNSMSFDKEDTLYIDGISGIEKVKEELKNR